MPTSSALRAIKEPFDIALRRFMTTGDLCIQYPDGERRYYDTGAPSGPAALIIFSSWRDVAAVAVNPSLGFGLGYSEGRITCPSESDLIGFLTTVMHNRRTTPLARAAANARRRPLNLHRRHQSRNIASHYNGQAEQWWYEHVLGPTWSYTCARFTTGEESLEEAQRAKMLNIAAKLGLGNEHARPIEQRSRILEIGSGWGYMACLLAQRFGVRVTGITIADDQIAVARDMAKEMGVDGLVEFHLVNYQELMPENGAFRRFDAAYSVGMFEHVPHTDYDDYYRILASAVKPGGRILVHCIANQFGAAPDPFIAKVIFPGSRLGSLPQMTRSAAKAGLVVRHVDNLYPHYVKTLRYWVDNHVLYRAEIVRQFGDDADSRLRGETFWRTRYYWLVASMVSFEAGDLSLLQTLYINGKVSPDPLPWSFGEWYTDLA